MSDTNWASQKGVWINGRRYDSDEIISKLVKWRVIYFWLGFAAGVVVAVALSDSSAL
jgi:hypothetical protein